MTASLPVLYSFRRCPYAMRARMALCLMGHKVRLREILLKDKPEEMLTASPKGTVPALVLPDGEVIDESLAVMEWAVRTGEGPLLPLTEEMRELIAENDGPFKHHLDRYKYATRYEDADAEVHRAAGAAFITGLNERLTVGGQLFGTVPSFADYAIFPFIRQFRIADMDWFDAQDWPHVHTWLARHMASPLFTTIMQKFPLWKETGEEVLFGRDYSPATSTGE
ncbi:glutathione S-transferase [Parvularcula marina]|uniref:Glutathione S-transferase n=1 Tax=Parvularcula marina TaxID=2292771 RepID=A0A371RIV4_9PROT|nr:glutathione S-transferase [Parvularcula marina]RFB05383.1 glutathione S-transferase [Parvularcula marina]